MQNKQGIIYAANQGGLLEFDGISWRTIEIPYKTVRSIDIDETGTIYVGGKSEIGFLSPDIKGNLEYVSLVAHLKADQKEFSNVWKTHAAKGGIYFDTGNYLFRWNSKQFDTLLPEPKHSFTNSFLCRANFFLHQDKIGIMQVINGRLELIPGGETFAADSIYMISPYDTEKILIGTRSRGFFLHNGINAVPFPTKADEYLKEKQLYHGIRLTASPDEFALATRLGGLVIIDSQGRLKNIFNKSNGLQDNSVKYVFEDFQGNLWLALEKGIAKIEYASPFSVFDDRSGLSGIVLSVIKHNNVLYVGTDNALYSQTPEGTFQPVVGIDKSYCWYILSSDDSLLVATTHNIFQVDDNNKNLSNSIFRKASCYVLHRSSKDINRIWAGTNKGLVSLYRKPKNKLWQEEYVFEEKIGEIKSIVEDKKGNLWLGLSTAGVIYVNFQNDRTLIHPVIIHYDKNNGLPDLDIKVSLIKDHIIFATDNGLFQFDESKQTFIPDRTLGDQFAGGKTGESIFRIVEDQDRNIWLHSNNRNLQAIPQPDGSFVINKKPFLCLPPGQTNAIFPDPDGIITWFATNDGLIRYDKTIKKKYDLNFTAIIRKITLNGKLIFEGDKSKQPRPTFSYNDRNLRFDFAAPFFEGESETRFHTFLEGYEKKWSEWMPEPQKEYTNLSSGSYTFHVQAKNVYENLSSEAAYKFKVLPPWYKTWWAFLVYAILSFFLVFFLIKWRSRQLLRDKQILEGIVKERTQEIKNKNRQLEDQSIKLQEMDQIKSRFFANISHEFRTPLTLILGPLEQMLAACPNNKEEEKRKLNMMLRNGQRLLRLINQLLELSKLDSGKMKLQAVKTDIIAFLKGIIDSFRLLAHQNELDLIFQAEGVEEIYLYLDPRKMEDVIANLLVNAFKFTPAGGKITVIIEQNSFVEISIRDTGSGIAEGDLPYVFDRFYQAESTYELHQKGTGIGLALAKELVELHHGTIEARSREGEGCTFIVRLPLGRDHLSPDQIVELPPSLTPTHDITSAEIPPGETETDRKQEPVEKKGKKQRTAPWALVNLEAVIGRDETDIILVVEDSADMCDYIRGALEPIYTVVDAKDGRDGIEKAQDIIPDLIISDIMMPGIDGYQLCRTLKNDVKTSHIPIILLTAKAAEENIIQGLETGADDYITKPFNTNILVARIKNLIDIRSQLQKSITHEMPMEPVKTTISSIDREFLKDLHEAIQKNLDDEDFNVEKLCKILYMGRTTLYRKVLALTGETPTDFIRAYRLKKGAELLKQNSTTVLEVAMAVGFSNSSYFAKCFKEKFHQLPSEYQTSSKFSG